MIVATAVIKSGGVLWCGHCALASIKMHPTHLFLLYDCICCTSGHGSQAAPLCYITISLCECDEPCTEPNLDTWWSQPPIRVLEKYLNFISNFSMLNFYFENFYPFLLNETGWRISGGGGDLDSTCTSLHLLAGSNDAKNLPDSLRIGIHDLPKKRWLHSDPSHYSEFMQGRHCTNCSFRARLLGLQRFVSVAKSVCSFARAVKTKG